jgi:hypothetical protein
MKPSWSCRALCVAALFSVDCARTLPGESPPDHAFYFPDGLAISPDGRYAYVASANFDLRYSSGWVSVVDVGAALRGAAIGDAVVSQVKVLSLGGGMALSAGGAMAAIGHRGAATLSLLEVSADGRSLSCGDAASEASLSNDERYTDCDRRHMLQTLCAAPQLGVDDRPDGCPWEEGGSRRVFAESLYQTELSDPFATLLFSHAGGDGSTEPLLAVSHLTPGDISNGQMSQLLLFRVESGTAFGESIVLQPLKAVSLGSAGISTVTARSDARGTFLAAATQQYDPRSSEYSTIYAVDVDRTLAEGRDHYAGHSVNREAGGVNLAGLAFAPPNGDRAYAANRSPDSIVVLDTTLEDSEERDADGATKMVTRPRFHVLDALPLPHRPASILPIVRQQGEDLLVVASFADDAVYLLSTLGDRLRVTARLDVPGHGPFALAHVSGDGRDFLLVTLFFSHSLLVYDVTGADASAFSLLNTLKSDKTVAAEPAR